MGVGHREVELAVGPHQGGGVEVAQLEASPQHLQSKRLLIESRWVSKPLASADKLDHEVPSAIERCQSCHGDNHDSLEAMPPSSCNHHDVLEHLSQCCVKALACASNELDSSTPTMNCLCALTF
eukprot:COSAG05_NODE_1559_length_4564_cov_2.602240_9_plen_124_part_00